MYHRHVINDNNVEEIVRTFNENQMQKENQKEFRTEKVIKRKGDKLYFKWKGYNKLFNSWIDKKDYYLMSEYYKWVNIFQNLNI